MTPTRYRIVLSDPNADLFEVSCTVADPDPGGQAFRLPAWSPAAVAGLRADPEGVDRLCRTANVGDVVEVHAFRRDELMSFAVEFAAARVDTCWLSLAGAAAPEAAARRGAWLGA